VTEVKIKRLPTMVAHGAIAWSICMPKTPDTGGQVTDDSIREAEVLYTDRVRRHARASNLAGRSAKKGR